MQTKIRVLSDQTINEIAAGEVIENPASVVKELVENAIDAGSTEITIEMRGGGRQLIRITDNGCGMSRDDALLCLERHATSKIRSSADIFSVSTLGFRGEAVPSIASISKFTLLTSPRTEEGTEADGTLIMVDGGRLASTGPAVRSPGTTIEVKQLFFNVPVRKKFQHSPVYDAQEIEKLCTAFALAHPGIDFHLIHNEKTVFKTSLAKDQDPLGTRIETLLGREFRQGLLPVNAVHNNYILKGYIGMPHCHRPNRSLQYLFLNGRNVTAPLLSYAVKEAYGTMLPPNRFPVFVLALEVPPQTVDVNVHPQKREVRFAPHFGVKELVFAALTPALHGLAPMEEPSALSFPAAPAYQYSEKYSERPFFQQECHQETKDELQEREASPITPLRNTLFSKESTHPLPWDRPLPALPSKPPLPAQLDLLESTFAGSFQPPKVLATLPGYLILDGSSLQALYRSVQQSDQHVCALLDQRRARQRIFYEQFLKVDDSPIALQNMLFPYAVDLTPADAMLVHAHLEDLQRIGLPLQQTGPHTWTLEALPAALDDVDIPRFFDMIIESLRHASSQRDAFQRIMAEQLSAAANRAASSPNRKLNSEEANALLHGLVQCKQPLLCPQGKSILALLAHNDLQRLFP